MQLNARISGRLERAGLSLYLLVVAMLLLGPWNGSAVAQFGLIRGAVQSGEYWRFLTGPLVHTGWGHWALNAFAVVVLQQLFGRELRTVVWLWAYAVTAVAIGISLLAFSRFGSVVGVSGVLHGLFACGACLALRRDALLAAGVLLVLTAKIGREQLTGGSAFVERLIGMPVATDTHLYGFAAGVVLGAALSVSYSRD